jgi:hypothetical protein
MHLHDCHAACKMPPTQSPHGPAVIDGCGARTNRCNLSSLHTGVENFTMLSRELSNAGERFGTSSPRHAPSAASVPATIAPNSPSSCSILRDQAVQYKQHRDHAPLSAARLLAASDTAASRPWNAPTAERWAAKPSITALA